MAEAKLGYLLKAAMKKNHFSEKFEEWQELLDAHLSNDLVRGTSGPTSVDEGNWLKLYKSAQASRRSKSLARSEYDQSAGEKYQDFKGRKLYSYNDAIEGAMLSIASNTILTPNENKVIKFCNRQTLKEKIVIVGTGLYSGRPVRLVLRPAAANHGVWFRRVDVSGGAAMIPARFDSVEGSPLCTKIVNSDGVSVSSIEHLMAALAGCRVTDAVIEIDGPEVPILDGSSRRFVSDIYGVGVRELAEELNVIRIIKTVEVRNGRAFSRIEPYDGLAIDFEIDFADAAIGRQAMSLDMSGEAFFRELSDCRTFCRLSDFEAMRDHGLAIGGVMENAVIVDGDKVLNPGGLRRANEAVRHKMLDALGDLSLAGLPIVGRFVSVRGDHMLTNALLHAIFGNPEAFRIEKCDERLGGRIPGIVHDQDVLSYVTVG